MHRRIWLFATLLTFILGCQSETDRPFSIAMNEWTGYQPLLLAREQGYLDTHQVHLATLGSTTESLQQFRAGIVDAVTITLDEALLLVSEGYDIAIILVMDISNGADAIIAQPGVTSLQQLKGKRVGVENTALGAYILARGLDMAGLQVSDINTIPITAEQASIFTSRQVDAIVTFEPILSQLRAQGGEVLFDSTMIPGEIIDVLAIRRSELATYHSQIRHVVQAWFQVLDYMTNEPEATATWLASHQHIDTTEAARILRAIRMPKREENRQLLGSSMGTIERMADIMLEKKLITHRPKLDGILLDSYVN